jgi:hypothetical protein
MTAVIHRGGDYRWPVAVASLQRALEALLADV